MARVVRTTLAPCVPCHPNPHTSSVPSKALHLVFHFPSPQDDDDGDTSNRAPLLGRAYSYDNLRDERSPSPRRMGEGPSAGAVDERRRESEHSTAVQVDSIKPGVESACGFSASNSNIITCLQPLLSNPTCAATTRHGLLFSQCEGRRGRAVQVDPILTLG